ncbi:MAG: amino acid racemase [Terriglobia bacterium]|nr:amino acid racemase [Terriglobia bacterium]
MNTLGIVGGLGPESTVDYYRSIITLFRERTHNAGYPHIIIDSLDVDEGIRLVETEDWKRLTEYLAEGFRRLAAAGADFGLMAANTPHIVFDGVRQHSSLPIISIVEATCSEVQRRGLKKVGLLGTGFTMGGRFYPEVFERSGIGLVPPSPEERAYIHEKYLGELLRGTFLPETREWLLEIIATLKRRDDVEAVVLAGTELPLILRADSASGIPLLDTTQIHVRAAVEAILA